MKVTIDQTKCVVCGSCVAICPEVFELRDDGSVHVKAEFEGVDVPAELEAKVREAQSMCPTSAIVITE